MRIFACVSGLAVVVLTCATAACGSDASAVDATTEADAPSVCAPACGAHAECVASACVCSAGYMGDGQACADIDECATGNGGCAVDADCANTDGARTCACRPGFVGDGVDCNPVWQRVAAFPAVTYDAGSQQLSAAIGARLFFAIDGNDASSLFRSFDTVTHALSGPLSATPGEFCACGLAQVIVSDGAALFMFGNQGNRYDPAADAWTPLASYDGQLGRGDAGGAFDPTTGTFVVVGGRDGAGAYQGSAIRLTTAGAITAEAGAAAVELREPLAYVTPTGSILYVAGGLASDNSARRLFRHTLGTSTWEALADAPADLFPGRGIGLYTPTLLYAATDTGVYLYDTGTNAWRPDPVVPPPGFQRALTAAGSVWAISSSAATGVEIYQLRAIE
ncbi:MAG: hypothetical protein IPL61_20590 [Myxococcales bacterium]|nr:hypothetical protein [Myxococcales bacterium]